MVLSACAMTINYWNHTVTSQNIVQVPFAMDEAFVIIHWIRVRIAIVQNPTLAHVVRSSIRVPLNRNVIPQQRAFQKRQAVIVPVHQIVRDPPVMKVRLT
jgi:hypothetical protein